MVCFLCKRGLTAQKCSGATRERPGCGNHTEQHKERAPLRHAPTILFDSPPVAVWIWPILTAGDFTPANGELSWPGCATLAMGSAKEGLRGGIARGFLEVGADRAKAMSR